MTDIMLTILLSLVVVKYSLGCNEIHLVFRVNMFYGATVGASAANI